MTSIGFEFGIAGVGVEFEAKLQGYLKKNFNALCAPKGKRAKEQRATAEYSPENTPLENHRRS
jgi:hypothetical protein